MQRRRSCLLVAAILVLLFLSISLSPISSSAASSAPLQSPDAAPISLRTLPPEHVALAWKSLNLVQRPPPSGLPSAAASSPSPPASAYHSNRSGLAFHVAKKKYMILQADNRLNWLFTHLPLNATSLPVFADNIVGPSVWSMFSWAQQHDYGYMFFASPDRVTGPLALVAFGAYWAKVSAILHVLRLLEHTDVEFVLLVDSDCSPRGNYALEDYMAALVRDLTPATVNKTHIFVNDDDGSFYSTMLATLGVYRLRGGAINSGAMLVRNSPQAQRLIERLWFNLTKEVSPFELMQEKSTIHVSGRASGAGEQQQQDVSQLAQTVAAHIKAQIGSPARVSDPIVDESGQDFSLTLTVQPSLTDSAQSFHAKRSACCAPECIAKLPGLQSPRVRCTKAKSISTLQRWPGDQDRLNWLRELDVDGEINSMQHSNVYLSSCFPGKLDVVVFHWCDSYWVKIRESQKVAAEQMPNASFFSSSLPSLSPASFPWALLRAAVPAMRLDPQSDGLPTLTVLNEFTLQARYALWNGRHNG
jgi:hypothetical protein